MLIWLKKVGKDNKYSLTYKEILTFDKVEIEEKKLVSKMISFGEKNINTFLVTCSIIIKLILCEGCFSSLLIINKYYTINLIKSILVY